MPIESGTGAPPRAPELRLFNVKYSPNLGDGLLSECLERALVECGASAASHSLDLAARRGYSAGSEARSLKLRVLAALPGFVRPLAVRAPLALAARRTWAPHYRSGLAWADAAVIGGGNLLADLDLNFPTKLSLALRACDAAALPAFIYGCGVSEGWSARGRRMMDEALATGTVRGVMLRDARSKAIWDRLFGERHGLPADIVRDPGLLAARAYGARRGAPDGPVGLNITSQIAVRYHSQDAPEPAALEEWYLGLARQVLESGRALVVFTNGSPEDRAALAALRPRLETLAPAGRLRFPDATTPAELVAIIAGLGGLVAFRMHAIIAAFALGVPFLALAWDPKLESFLESVGLPQLLCRVGKVAPADAAGLLAHAIAHGLPEQPREAVIAEARADVAMLYSRLAATLA